MITFTPVHPQANGQAESSNKIIVNNLKERLGAKKGRSAKESMHGVLRLIVTLDGEDVIDCSISIPGKVVSKGTGIFLEGKSLPFVLWADRMTVKSATGQTRFPLVFGVEAVIPTEMVIPTARFNLQDPEQNPEVLCQELDTIDETRDAARLRMAAYQQRISKAYNKNIRTRRFQVGDWVLRKGFQNTTNPADGKLAPKREGPYEIESESGKGAYQLKNMEGDMLPRSWNAIHLKLYFK